MYELIFYSSSIIIIDYILNLFIFNRLICWYILHAYCNFFIVYKCLPHMINFIYEPISFLQDTTELDIYYYALIPHIYHCIAFNINKDDLFHHVFFVFIGSIIKYNINVGKSLAFYLFFSTGLPGGIDYILLSLYKLNIITKQNRHIIALFLNSWFRCPGLIFSNTLVIIFSLIHKENIYSKIFNVVTSLLIWGYNGLYYNYQVRDSYIINYQRKELLD